MQELYLDIVWSEHNYGIHLYLKSSITMFSCPGSNNVNKETPKKSNVVGEEEEDMEEEAVRPLQAANLSVREGEVEVRGAKRAELAGGPTYKVCMVDRGVCPFYFLLFLTICPHLVC